MNVGILGRFGGDNVVGMDGSNPVVVYGLMSELKVRLEALC